MLFRLQGVFRPGGFIALILLLLLSGSCDTTSNDSKNNSGEVPAASASHEGAPARGLSILDPRVRAVPPGVRVSAAYMRIANRTESDDRLIAVRMAGAGQVEIHETVVDDAGVMRMRPLTKGLPVPAGETVELQPGGAHIMLMQLSVEPRAGESVELECEFADAGIRRVMARVFDAE